MQLGYNKEYLGSDFVFDLPTITAEHQSKVVYPINDKDPVLKYPNYSLVVNKETRQAFYSAANANFNRNKGKGRRFRLDGRIEEKYQLDNFYYKDLDGVENPYDRGHLTRRDAISWGNTPREANKASKDSCYFTNVSLQHKNFNQDEWGALEDAIEDNQSDLDNRFNIMCGPIFTGIDRIVRPYSSMEPGLVPSAFWKLIAYIGIESGKLETNAFIVFQDDEAMSRMKQIKGNRNINPFEIYQSSTTLIEQLTGLEFPEVAFDNNPMFFFESDVTKNLNITTPQLHHVCKSHGANSGILFRQ